MVVAQKNEVLELMARGRREPSWYMTHALDVEERYLWSKMREVANSVRDHERTAVGAGHGVSKTFSLGRLGLWFLSCHYPSTVITTAPTGYQVKNQLWREIRQCHSNSRVYIGGKLSSTMLDLQPETGIKWFATGFSTRPDTVTQEATRFQGFHNEHVLVIFDEAAGILHEIWRAAEHIGAPFKRFVAVGNPTNAAGDFAEALSDPSYNQIRISVKDTPNFKTGKTIIPGVYGREYEQRIRLKYGADSDEYGVRVEGKVSKKGAEGAYYGKLMEWLRTKGRLTEVPHNGALPVYTVWDPGYTTAIWFFQKRGMEIAFIRAYEDSGLGMEHWAPILERLEKDEGYRYGGHFAPVDTQANNAYKAVAGKSLFEHAQENGINLTILRPEYRVMQGIERTRQFLYRCWFDRTNCKAGIKALDWYCEKRNLRMSTEDQPVFSGYPEPNFARHLADAMRYASLAIHRLPTGDEEAERDEIRRLHAKHRRPAG